MALRYSSCSAALLGFLLSLVPASATGQQFTISTYAGGVVASTPVAATSASIGFPKGVAVDSAGNAYFTALNVVFKVDTGGVMTRVAGTGRSGFSGDGGPAVNAQLALPADWARGGIAVDGAGNLYIADYANNRIRKVTKATGVISTIAGTGNCCNSTGDGGQAVNAILWNPAGVAVDSSGNVYIADTTNNKIRMVSTSGVISTVAGNGGQGLSGDTGAATGAQLNHPTRIAIDGSTLYIADQGNKRIRKVIGGTITTVAGGGASFADNVPATSTSLNAPQDVAVDSNGHLYIADINNNRVRVVIGTTISTVVGNGQYGASGDGQSATSATLSNNFSIAIGPSNQLFIADEYTSRLRKVTSGTINLLAGNGQFNYNGEGIQATTAQMGQIRGLALDSAGNLYVSEPFNFRIRKIAPNGTITTFAGDGICCSGNEGGPATSVHMNAPLGLRFDTNGNLYFADGPNNSIRKIDTNGILTTVAGTGAAGFSGDTGPATAAQLNFPNGVAIDSDGAIYIADTGNNRIRKIVGTTITTVAGGGSTGLGDGGQATSAQLSNPNGIAVDAAHNLYIADTNVSRIRKVATNGIITTYVGTGQCCNSPDGPAGSVQIQNPIDVFVDAAGYLYFSDYWAGVRIVTPAGNLVTVAGNGGIGFNGDGGPATLAQLGQTTAIAVSPTGDIYAGSYSSGDIRRLALVPLAIKTSSLPTAYNSIPYSLNLAAAGGHPAYNWSLTSGTLPSGLNLSASGLISGMTSVLATTPLTFKVTDSYNPAVNNSTTLSLVSTNPVPVVNSLSSTSALAGSSGFTLTLNGSGFVNGLSTVQWAGSPRGTTFVSESQLTVTLAPSDLATPGSFNVTVMNGAPGGGTSAPAVFTVAGSCSYQISPTSAGASLTGSSGMVQVTAPAGCTWTANSSSGFVNITSGSSGSGSGTVGYSVAADTGLTRSGTLTIAGMIFTVTQTVASGPQYVMSTFAGGVTTATPAPALNVPIGAATKVVADGGGNVYFGSYAAVYKIDPSGTLFRIAGNGRAGYAGDNGPAATAQLGVSIGGLLVDAAGNLYVADSNNARIRKIAPNGIITTFAGNGGCCFSGDGGAATAAQLNYPVGMAFDAAGNLFFADQNANRVRKVSTSGIITTVAGDGNYSFGGDGGSAMSAQMEGPTAVAVDSSNNLYIADNGNRRVRKVSGGTITTYAGNGNCCNTGDNGPAASAALQNPQSLAVDATGNLYLADQANRLRIITTDGMISTYAGDGNCCFGGDGGAALNAHVSSLQGVSVDPAGNILIADTYNNYRIRKISNGIISTIAGNGTFNDGGDGGAATSAQLGQPTKVKVDANNNVYITDQNNLRVRKVSGGTITTVAGNGTNGFSGDGGPATSAQLSQFQGSTIDAAGNIYISDTYSSRIRMVSTGGTISTIAGNGNYGYSGDGGLATSAQIGHPAGITVDGAGVIYFADPDQHVVRKFTVGGTISTVAGTGVAGFSGDTGNGAAAQLNAPRDVAVDAAGNIYIADSGNNRVRGVAAGGVVVASGTIFTIAGNGNCCTGGDGGQAASAQLGQPYGLAFDTLGNLYISDTSNRIRVVAPSGIISTIAGSAYSYTGDGGPALNATMAWPLGVAVGPGGKIYVADTNNSAIRLLTPLTLAVATTTLPPATPNVSYSQSLVAEGGQGGYTWTISGGALPTGFNLSPAGAITGSTNQAGTANFTVQVKDGVNTTALANLSIDVSSLPGIYAGGIVNAASFTAPLAAGSSATLFGFNLASGTQVANPLLPTTLAGTTVKLNGIAVPLSFVSSSQINFQVPWELAGQSTAAVTVTTSAGTSPSVNVALASAAPGTFTTNSAGTGQGAIYTSKGVLNSSSNPAYPGAQIQIYVTGLGAVTNQPANGAIAGLNSGVTALPAVAIGGVPATVVSAGLVNSSTLFTNIVGAYRIVATVPAGAVGNAVTVVVTAGGNSSLPVTMAVAAQPGPPVITVGSNYVLSIGVQEISLNAVGGDGNYVWSLVSGTLPPGCSVRPDGPSYFAPTISGDLSCITSVPGTSTFTLGVTSAGQTATQVFTVKFSTLRARDGFSLPDAFLSVPYAGYTFSAIGNAGSVTWTAGGLPPGMSLSQGGVLTGMPQSTGNFGLNLTLNDGVDNVGWFIPINVYAVQFTSPNLLASAVQFQPYSATVTASGGTGPYAFTSNNLPTGFTLNANTGVISGTPTGVGRVAFNVTVTDANQLSYTTSTAFVIIGAPKHLPSISYNLDDCTFGSTCIKTLTANSGGTPPFTWNVTGLPSGMGLRSGVANTNPNTTTDQAEIWGTPTQLGTFPITVTVTDADGVTARQTFPLIVSPLQLSPGLVNGTRGVFYSSAFRIAGGSGPWTVQQLSGSYAGGLTLNGMTLSGTPLENGFFNESLLFKDSAGHTLHVNNGMSIANVAGATVNINNGQILGPFTLNSGVNVTLSACCVPSYTWSLLSGTLPTGLNLSPGGVLFGTATAAGTYTYLVQAADASNPSNTATRQFTTVITPLSISTSGNLTYNKVGGSISQTFAATGANGTVTWTLDPNSILPPGLSLSSDGTLSGQLTQSGYYSFTVTATDGAGNTRSLTPNISIYPQGVVPPLGLNQGPSLGNFVIGVTSFQLTANGGVPPYHFSYTPTATPIPGMRVIDGTLTPTNFPNNVTGGLAGIIATPGVYTTSVRVTDSANTTFDRTLTWTAYNLVPLTQNTLPKASVNVFYSTTFTGYGGSGNYSWSASGLPAGLTMSNTGVLSGTPAAAINSASFTVTLTDLTTSLSLNFGYTLTVNPFTIVTSGILPQGTVGTSYSQTLSAPGCGSGCTWSVVNGSLPSGLSLSNGGVLSGNPSNTFNSGFLIQASGPNGTVQKEFSLQVVVNAIQPLFINMNQAITPSNLSNFSTVALFAIGGTAPYTFELIGGQLPPGISLQTPGETLGATLLPGFSYLAGRAMQVGTFGFTLKVTDAASHTATRDFSWNVLTPSINYVNLPLNNNPLLYNTPYSQQLLVLGGSGVYTSFTLASGALPPGLTLESNGVIHGTPIATGSYTAGVTVVDSVGNTATQNVNLFVSGPTATNVFPGVNASYTGAAFSANSFGWFASGGSAPYTYSALTALPPGCIILSGNQNTSNVGSASASLFCNATPPGSYPFTVQAMDAGGNIGVANSVLQVSTFALFSSTSLPTASVGVAYSSSLIFFGPAPSISLAPGSALPPGLAIVGSSIAGSPTQAGNYNFTLSGTDANNIAASGTFTLTVSTINITNPDIIPVQAVTGVPYSYAFTATGGGATKTWSASSLPSGLSISPTTGVVSGVVNQTAISAQRATITVTDGTSTYSHPFTFFTHANTPALPGFAPSSTLLPDALVGGSVTITLSPTGGVGPYTWTVPSGSSLPPGLQLVRDTSLSSYSSTQTVGVTYLQGTATTAGDYTFDLIATDSNNVSIRRTFTMRVTALAIVTGLHAGNVGAPYSAQLTVVGGAAPYTFTYSANIGTDMLPTGLNAASSGLISGTPTSTGNYFMTVKVTDKNGLTFIVPNFSLSFFNGIGLEVTTPTPTGIRAGIGSITNLSTNGTSSYQWTASGNVPPGFDVLPNGVLAGFSSAGSYTFTVRATDTNNPSNFAERTYTMVVQPEQIVRNRPSQFPAATVGAAYSTSIAVAGGKAPYTFTPLTSSPTPPGLTLNSDGTLTGTPTQSGSFNFMFKIIDANNLSGVLSSQQLAIVPQGGISPLLPIGSTGAPQASLGAAYVYPLDPLVFGGVGPFTWAVANGSNLPPGLKLIPGANGVSTYIGGVPTTPGSYSYSLVVTDAMGQTGTTSVSAFVSPISVNSNLTVLGTVGANLTTTLVPSGGVAPYNYTLVTGSGFPPGLDGAENGTSLTLFGKPTNSGWYSVSILITDHANNSLTTQLLFVIDDATHQAQGVAIAPSTIQMNVVAGTQLAPVQVAFNTTSGSVPYTANVGGIAGLTLSATSGNAPATATLNLDTSGLAPGTYSGLLAVSAPQSAAQYAAVPVVLTVINAPPCQYGLNSNGSSFVSTGGKGSFTVNTGASCAWTTSGSDLWINVHGIGGQGPQAVDFDVASNTGINPRTGSITVGPQTFTITQFGSACALSINPSTVNVTSLGGQAMVKIGASNNQCSWTASGLHVSQTSGKGNATVMVQVDASGSPGPQMLTATIAGQTFTVNQGGANCSASLSAPSTSVPAGGGPGQVNVTLPGSCTYDTVTGPSWLTVSSGGSGSGPGPAPLSFLAAANSTTLPRSGTLTIGGQPFTVNQEGTLCSVTMNTSGLGGPFGSAGGAGSIAITANGPNCAWTAVSDSPWASVAPASGTGSANVNVTVTSNAASSSPRSSNLTIAGQTIAVMQSGTACMFSLGSGTASVPYAGGSGSVRLSAPAVCGWTSTPDGSAPWLSISSSGTAGTSDVTFVAAPNTSTASRSGTLTIAGQPYVVTQGAAPCTYSLSTANTTLAADGGSSSFTFTTVAGGCTAAAQSYSNWLTVTTTSAPNGTSGTVNFTALPNVSGMTRSGTIQLAGQTYTVKQTGAACAYSLTSYGALFGQPGGSGQVVGSPSAEGCTPTTGVDQPTILTLGALSGPTLDLFTQPFSVATFNSVSPGIRKATVTFGGQVFTIKQTSW